MKAVRFITDTTLLNFSKRMCPAERMEWAGMLDSIGVHEIVLPFSSRKELDAYATAIRHARQAVYVAMNPALLAKVLRVGPQTIHLEVPVSYPMIYTAYHKNKDWARKSLLQCRDLLMEAGVSVSLVLSDASRAEPCFLEQLVQLTAGMRIDKLIAKDIMGIQTMSGCVEQIGSMREFGYAIGYEGSDQFGLSVANTIQALRSGATYATCCLDGTGGGCDLRRLLHTTSRVFRYDIDRKGAEQLDRAFKQQYRSERLHERQNNRFADCRIR